MPCVSLYPWRAQLRYQPASSVGQKRHRSFGVEQNCTTGSQKMRLFMPSRLAHRSVLACFVFHYSRLVCRFHVGSRIVSLFHPQRIAHLHLFKKKKKTPSTVGRALSPFTSSYRVGPCEADASCTRPLSLSFSPVHIKGNMGT